VVGEAVGVVVPAGVVVVDAAGAVVVVVPVCGREASCTVGWESTVVAPG
jgi:hypothetical protein